MLDTSRCELVLAPSSNDAGRIVNSRRETYYQRSRAFRALAVHSLAVAWRAEVADESSLSPRPASRDGVAKEDMESLALQKRVTTNTRVATRLARLLEGRLMGR